MIVNSILWVAKVPVPKNGAKIDIQPEDLTRNRDEKPRK
jgi:hypothetical protein